jgi:Domain of unknown function (DUF4159)
MKLRRTLTLLLLAAGIASAQRWGRRGGDMENIRTAREVPSGSTGTPTWEYPDAFKTDVFTFARIRYQRGGGRGWGRGGWATDLPDSDLNLSWRLQQMTSLKVDPDARIINPTDPELANYPFIYIAEPGGLSFSEEEATAMRQYLENGGFLLLDDFWGEDEWANCEEAIKQVLPNRSFQEIPLTHPLYRSVFTIKEKAQVPNIDLGAASEHGGPTNEREDAEEVHHRAIFDDKGRPMVIALHNTDNGDGWEREGESAYYFKQFSERTAYPLAINIIFYVMTH